MPELMELLLTITVGVLIGLALLIAARPEPTDLYRKRFMEKRHYSR